MKLPCKDCLILAICYNNKEKIVKCELVNKFVNENIFKTATDMVKKEPGTLGFYWYVTEHPIDDKFVLGIKILAHADEIFVEEVQKFMKV